MFGRGGPTAEPGEAAGNAGEPPVQMFGSPEPDGERPADPDARRLGRVTLRFRVPERLLVQWRALERAHAESGAPGTYVEFLCVTFFATWVHQTDQWPVKWRRIYQRDLCGCASPICWSRDKTLHHLVFRSKGGGDEDENVTGGPCPFCHLMGVHALGSIRIEPPATNMTWTFGRKPFMEVKGREKRLLG
jgi:hypothetical protein